MTECNFYQDLVAIHPSRKKKSCKQGLRADSWCNSTPNVNPPFTPAAHHTTVTQSSYISCTILKQYHSSSHGSLSYCLFRSTMTQCNSFWRLLSFSINTLKDTTYICSAFLSRKPYCCSLIITSLLKLVLILFAHISMVWFISFIPLYSTALHITPICEVKIILSHSRIALNNLVKMSSALSPTDTYTGMSSHSLSALHPLHSCPHFLLFTSWFTNLPLSVFLALIFFKFMRSSKNSFHLLSTHSSLVSTLVLFFV